MSEPISKYLSITRAYRPRLSSDGRLLVFISDTAGTPQIYEMPLAGDLSHATWRNQITRGGERVLDCWFSPAADDQRLIYSRDTGGDENFQFFLIDPDEPDNALLTAGFEHARHMWGDWSADGSQFLFASNRRDTALFDLYIQTIGETARMVWQNDQPGFLGPIRFAPDGRRAIVVRTASRFKHELFEIDLDSDSLSQLSPPDESIRFAGVQFSGDGQAIYLNTDLDSNYLYIARLDLETLDIETVVDADHDIEHMTISPDGKSLAYTINSNGVSELWVMDLATREVRAAPLPDDMPGVVAGWDSCLTFAPTSRHIAFSYTSPIRTADIYIWNVDSNQISAITRSSHGNVGKETFQLPESIDIAGSGGQTIPAWFYRPAGDSNDPAPALLYVCGGPETAHRPALDSLIQYLLSRGIAVLAPNVRGSSGYGKQYAELGNTSRRMDAVADLVEAAHWLRKQSGIDPDRLAIYGEGYGGFLALAALSKYPDLWAAGVDVAGISSLASFLGSTSAYRRAYEEAEYGSLSSDQAFLESISPIHQAKKITAPLMIVHGANNPLIPRSESEQLAEELKGRTIPFEYLPMDGEGAEIVSRLNRRRAYGAVVEFLERYLLSA